jgi:hypothetical protein
MKSIQPDNRPAWSQQRGESTESFAVFVIYRDLGPDRSLAEAQRLKGKPQDALKTATGKRNVSGCMKRWSRRWAWADRAAAWDVMLEAERTAAVRVAMRTEGERQARRWVEFREDAHIQLSQLSGQIKQLTLRALMRIKTTKEGTPTAQRVEDQREVITELNPALDLQRAIHAQTELAQLCFGDLKLTDAEPDVVTEGEARLVSRPPGSATEDS